MHYHNRILILSDARPRPVPAMKETPLKVIVEKRTECVEGGGGSREGVREEQEKENSSGGEGWILLFLFGMHHFFSTVQVFAFQCSAILCT